MSRRKKPLEAVNGSYTPVPHFLLDSKAFQFASVRAKALLFDLLRQHTGYNNGHLQLSTSWLRKRGWTSNDQIQKAKEELIERNLITKVRLGGLGIGPDQYALTWIPISNYTGLDIRKNGHVVGAFHTFDLPEKVKKLSHPNLRDRLVPEGGVATSVSDPQHGTKMELSDISPIPHNGNNECCQLLPAKYPRRVVGKVGRSGRGRKEFFQSLVASPIEK